MCYAARSWEWKRVFIPHDYKKSRWQKVFKIEVLPVQVDIDSSDHIMDPIIVTSKRKQSSNDQGTSGPSNGKDINNNQEKKENNKSRTPLMEFIMDRHSKEKKEISDNEVKLFFKNDISINKINEKNGKTALTYAIICNDWYVFKKILEIEEVDINIKDEENKRAIDWCYSFSNVNYDMLRLLISHQKFSAESVENENTLEKVTRCIFCIREKIEDKESLEYKIFLNNCNVIKEVIENKENKSKKYLEIINSFLKNNEEELINTNFNENHQSPITNHQIV